MEYHKIVYRTLLYVLICCFFVSCNERTNPNAGRSEQAGIKDTATAATNVSAEPDRAPADVEEIQKAYATIMAQMEARALDSTSFKYNCYNEKSGTVTYFSENDELRMIVHRHNEYDHHAAVDHYFVKDSTLFFVYLTKVLWAFESGAEGATRDNTTEQRIYLVDEKPIKCLEKQFVVRSQAANNPRSEIVANKEVDCAPLKSVTEPYRVLLKYRNETPPGCLED